MMLKIVCRVCLVLALASVVSLMFYGIWEYDRYSQEREKERYEYSRSLVLMRLEVPGNYRLLINDKSTTCDCVYMSTKNQYKLDWFKDGKLEKTVFIVPSLEKPRPEIIKP